MNRHMGPPHGRGRHSADRGKAGEVRLGDLGPGTTGTIRRLSCGRMLRRRLMNMGVVAGTPFEIVKVAPLGDPIELKLKDFPLTLRNEEAGDIWVRVNDE